MPFFLIPVNSRWTGYGAWGACSTRCGSGTQTRSRSCIAGNACGTGCSGPSTESRACGMAIGEWGICWNDKILAVFKTFLRTL